MPADRNGHPDLQPGAVRARTRRFWVIAGLVLSAGVLTGVLTATHPDDTEETRPALSLSGVTEPARTRAALPGWQGIKAAENAKDDDSKDSDSKSDKDSKDSGDSEKKSDKKSDSSDSEDKGSKHKGGGSKPSSTSSSSSSSSAPSSSSSSTDSTGGDSGEGPTTVPGAGGGKASPNANNTDGKPDASSAKPTSAAKPSTPPTGGRATSVEQSCNKRVPEAELNGALATATPGDVICVERKTGTSAGQASPTPSARPSSTAPTASRTTPSTSAPAHPKTSSGSPGGTSKSDSSSTDTNKSKDSGKDADDSGSAPTAAPPTPRSTNGGGGGSSSPSLPSGGVDGLLARIFDEVSRILGGRGGGGSHSSTQGLDIPDDAAIDRAIDEARSKVQTQSPTQAENNTGQTGWPTGPTSVCEGGTCQQTNRSSGGSSSSESSDSSRSSSPSTSSADSSSPSGSGPSSRSRSSSSSGSSRTNSATASPSSSSGTDSAGDDSEGDSTTSSRPSASASAPTATAPAGDSAASDNGVPDAEATPCTKEVDGAQITQAISAAAPGERICATGGQSAARLEISKGGSADKPLYITGGGNTVVKGITVKADHVVVDGFKVLEAKAPGIEITANNVVVSNNYVDHPTGGDFDGMRFFGNNLKIVHNTITNINPGGGGAHADCMQTFTSGKPSSQNVLIDSNRCEKIKNICLMAEGPGDVGDGGGGDGTSADWTYSNNYCEFGASQGLMIEAIQNVTIKNNEFQGSADKAIGLDIGATGAKVSANKIGAGIKAAVGMSSNSKEGYQGPQPQGGP